ncbi:MAG: hypothetical protein Q9195_008017 [Heterodermia aff. obscurata]
MAMQGDALATQGTSSASTSCSYFLKPLVQDVQLSEKDTPGIKITCVELWESSLYIGTSAAEVLHYVSIPPEPTDETQSPTFIFASRLQPTFTQSAPEALADRGIQQILILPSISKACVLCNGTVNFYSLPELSPAFANAIVSSCTWIGGMDLNSPSLQPGDPVTIMLCLQKRARLVQIGDSIKLVRNIEYPSCLTSARRNQFACVADSQSYALLDVENQQKISLFPISSLNTSVSAGVIEDISSPPDRSNRNSGSLRPVSRDEDANSRGHGRNTSLGALVGGLTRRQGSPQPKNQDRNILGTPEPPDTPKFPPRTSSRNRSISAAGSPSSQPATQDKPLPPPPDSTSTPKAASLVLNQVVSLVPHICSPTPSEFLLTTGTGVEDPGVGVFVNLDGDVVRGTLEFARYPRSIVADGGPGDLERNSNNIEDGDEGYVLAAMTHPEFDDARGVIEIQRWDGDSAEKELLDIPPSTFKDEGGKANEIADFGIRELHTTVPIAIPDIGAKLRARRLRRSLNRYDDKVDIEIGKEQVEEWEARRNDEEIEFGRRLGGQSSHIAVWSGASVWWAVRNSLVMRLDTAIDGILNASLAKESALDREQLIMVINSIRGQEATTETDFLGMEYLRQRVSLVLFADLAMRSRNSAALQGAGVRITEALLLEGGIDPRVVLPIIPFFKEDIFEGEKGIWVHAGLIETIKERPWMRHSSQTVESSDRLELVNEELASLVKRYLNAWRKRKGFGSIADEVEVFQTIDAALLHILLYLDRPHASRIPSSRAELYAVVDSGVDCFERSISLLEEYHRLYVLSRLYQQRKMGGQVLNTWTRIIEGERDNGGELVEGENEVRKYLVRTRDRVLVEQYGTWLARRNASLGVQVFTDDNRRVKLEPQEVVQLLRREAPDAVKVYLEHLVFGKKSFQYANDLISYYLDSVLAVLDSSEEARSILSQSYESYRALHPPKPTYRQFVIENALSQAWWQDRLRLLELLGGSHGADFSYDVAGILARIEPFEKELVPESIIIDGRQGRHQQAIRLLVHGLGDYHTAVNYCLLGGASIFHPATGSMALAEAQSRDEQVILFGYLLSEFLQIEDFNDRLERTSELLERFGSWYDVHKVLELIPESWSVDLVSGFLVGAFRRLVSEKNEAMIVKSLSGSENLQVALQFVEKSSEMGPQIERLE